VLKVHLFGGVRLQSDDGREVAPQGVHAQRLLAYLALNAGRRVSKAEIALDLWGKSEDPSDRRMGLNRVAHELRRIEDAAGASVLAPYLRRGRGWLLLGGAGEGEPLWVDALEFDRRLAQGEPRQALGYAERGELLSGVGPEVGEAQRPGRRGAEWVRARQRDYAVRVSDAFARVTEEAREQGRLEDALDTARRWLHRGPGEEALLAVIEILVQAGREHAAVEEQERFTYMHPQRPCPAAGRRAQQLRSELTVRRSPAGDRGARHGNETPRAFQAQAGEAPESDEAFARHASSSRSPLAGAAGPNEQPTDGAAPAAAADEREQGLTPRGQDQRPTGQAATVTARRPRTRRVDRWRRVLPAAVIGLGLALALALGKDGSGSPPTGRRTVCAKDLYLRDSPGPRRGGEPELERGETIEVDRYVKGPEGPHMYAHGTAQGRDAQGEGWVGEKYLCP